MLKDEENARPARDLKERSKRYSLEIIRMVTSLPLGRVADVLGRQVLRSATSVGIFPGRTTVPKTLIFAKDDGHTDDVVKIAR